MLVTAILTSLGTLGVGFFLRFFVALCKDRSTELRGYWVQPNLTSDGGDGLQLEIEVTKRAA